MFIVHEVGGGAVPKSPTYDLMTVATSLFILAAFSCCLYFDEQAFFCVPSYSYDFRLVKVNLLKLKIGKSNYTQQKFGIKTQISIARRNFKVSALMQCS